MLSLTLFLYLFVCLIDCFIHVVVVVVFHAGKVFSDALSICNCRHHHAGLKRDAASLWIEDVTQSSFKVCLRELQNYAGSYEDVQVVSVTASVKQDLSIT